MATRKTSKPQEATAMLRADHARVSALFGMYDKSRSVEKKKTLLQSICQELKVHTEIEETIFYPAVQGALKDHELVPEANVEHATIKSLIEQIDGGQPGPDEFEAKVKVMAEYVKHHVKEEHTEMFPKAKKTKLDMRALGARMAERKAQLMASPG
ncbi:MAG TPA: hemerythrin domain-containing protein [Burkholderiaceae bacterium]